MTYDLEGIAAMLVTNGKGILAAAETVPTLTRRFDALGIRSTEQSRRTYREMLYTPPGAAEFISGVILQDETIRQKSSGGTPLAQVLSNKLSGIKVDTGTKPLAGSPGETVTEGLNGLRDRLSKYRDLGARFAKWRAVIDLSDTLPSPACVIANAHALARYAALCQEQHVVPTVEPEVLMDGAHMIEGCTSQALSCMPYLMLFSNRASRSRFTRSRGTPDRAAAWTGQHLLLDAGALCVLGYYRDIPAMKVSNGPLTD